MPQEASPLTLIAEVTHSGGADLPFRHNDAEIMTPRGSLRSGKNLQAAFAEIYRVLKYGGVAFTWRDFPDDRPSEPAATIRAQQHEGGFVPDYNVPATARGMKRIMESLKVQGYRTRTPKPTGGDDINDGIEFHEKHHRRTRDA
jgi:hypothetical protein